MGALASLSIIGTVITFMIGALGGFPLSSFSSDTHNVTGDPSYSAEAVHEAADAFSGAYTSIIEELISFPRDPDYERAETRRQQVTDFATSLVGDFQDLEERLTGQLENLTSGGAGTTAEGTR